jgi:carotenoid cleavage dioxygenase-like enzyme
MTTGRAARWDTDASIGEVGFVPRTGATEALDGCYLTFARTVSDDRSWLYVRDAADFAGPPRARVAIPAVVRGGLHASWFALRAR